MKQILEKTGKWIRNNGVRLLAYAVILTSCFSIKNAAYGKYVDYVKDFTSATAAPFYFSSNYLGDASEQKSYTVGTFNGSLYELDVEIRNNDNAFNFDESPQGFFYYVTAELYKDSKFTRPYVGEDYSTSITYGQKNEYAAGMARSVKTYEWGSKSQIKSHYDPVQGKDVEEIVETTGWIKSKNINIDSNSERGYNNTDEFKLVGYLKGSETKGEKPKATDSEDKIKWTDVTTGGKQTVRITIGWSGTTLPTDLEDGALWLKVTAHTIPATKINKLSDYTSICNIDTSNPHFQKQISVLFPADYTNAYTGTGAFPDLSSDQFKPEYEKEQGIYATEITGTFKLKADKSSGEGNIVRASFSKSSTDYAVLYTFTSNITTLARIYYDGNKLKPDESLGKSYPDNTVKKTGNNPDNEYYTHYVLTNVFANGSKSCYFYKKTLSTEVVEDDVTAVKASAGDQEETESSTDNE